MRPYRRVKFTMLVFYGEVLSGRLERLHQILISGKPILQLRAVPHAHHGVHYHPPGLHLTCAGAVIARGLREISLKIVDEPLPMLPTDAALLSIGHSQQFEKHVHLFCGLWLAIVWGGELNVTGGDIVEDLEETTQLGCCV